jgi:hypothetical protein
MSNLLSVGKRRDIIDLTVHLTEKAIMRVRMELVATWNRGELER